MPSLIKNWH
jgi:hypothetical protein